MSVASRSRLFSESASPDLAPRLEPHVRANMVLLDASPVSIHQAQSVLRLRKPLRCSFPIPLYRLRVILRDTASAHVDQTENELGFRISLLCCQAKPPTGFSIILRYLQSFRIQSAEIQLRFGKTLRGRQVQTTFPPPRRRARHLVLSNKSFQERFALLRSPAPRGTETLSPRLRSPRADKQLRHLQRRRPPCASTQQQHSHHCQ